MPFFSTRTHSPGTDAISPFPDDSYRDPSMPPNQLGLSYDQDTGHSISRHHNPLSIGSHRGSVSRTPVYRSPSTYRHPSAFIQSHFHQDDDDDIKYKIDGDDDNNNNNNEDRFLNSKRSHFNSSDRPHPTSIENNNLQFQDTDIPDRIRLINLTTENARLKREIRDIRVQLTTMSYVFFFFLTYHTDKTLRDMYEGVVVNIQTTVNETKDDIHKLIHHLSTTLAGQIPGSESPGIPLNPKQADYPYIKYWTQNNWMRIKKDPKLKQLDQESSIASLFYEDEHGIQVSDDIKAAVRRDLIGYWNNMVTDKNIPKPWGLLGFRDQNKFRSMMEGKYPWLRLCDGHWKARQIWISNWKSDRYPIPVSESPPSCRDETPRLKIVEISSSDSLPSPETKRKRVVEDNPRPVSPKRQKGKGRMVETTPFLHLPPKPRPAPTRKVLAKVATVSVLFFNPT